jgi:hypothetical protein
MTNDGNRTDSRTREYEARDRAAQGQSSAPGDSGEGSEGERAGVPPAQAGAPPVEQQERSSLDSPSQSGRPRDEGDDQVERSRDQTPRTDPEAVRPPGSPGPDDHTM